MPLSYRLRGTVWYARGTLRVGLTTIQVAEFSTGASRRTDAEAFAEAEARKIVEAHLEGSAGRARRLTIADLFLAYLQRPGGVHEHDQARIAELNSLVGTMPATETLDAWKLWLDRRGSALAPSTAARWRAIYVAALHYGCSHHALAPPTIPTVAVPEDERVVWLTHEQQQAMLASYNPFAARPVLALCYQGFRTQECLQAQWAHIDLARGTWFVPKSKTGKARTVALHPRVRAMIEGLDAAWRAKHGSAPRGHVFLSQRGQPYADTRAVSKTRKYQGGNPLAQAHETACRNVGLVEPDPRGGCDPKTGEPLTVVWFRVHDWRHHWASWQVMNSTDLITLQRMGGWKDMRSVARYASVSDDHMAQAIARMR